MNVKLAMQTLSNSVYCSLLFFQKIDDDEVQQVFAKSQATAVFCKTFNDISDMLNCKNKFAKDTMNVPLNDANIDYAIACRGGFNNNPNAFQFRSAYKRLLIRHELREFENGNCLFDGIDILH
ncbi:hypothetical protein PV325_007516, partial [Microctonus aethiopoides]